MPSIQIRPGKNDPAPHHFVFASGYDLHFQDGPIKIVGENGLQHADLLEALVLRAQNFYDRFGGDENLAFLTHVKHAQEIDAKRTARRLAAGTEGRTPGA